jgi:DNA invertase Pin-like site-specific DNA recombinase
MALGPLLSRERIGAPHWNQTNVRCTIRRRPPGVYDPRGMGKMFFALLAGFAELEREMMTERTRDGLAQAAAEGRHGARRPVISRDMMRIALGRRADGESATSIARGLTYKTAGGQERTVSRRALYNAFRAHDTEQAAGTA